MKPIKLVMSAFGSYGGLEEIDFRQVNRGIFLITGDTGAGKTTVFDAITYALFDGTSGGKRDGDMMRSQYAQEGTPTFVEYTFSYGQEIYHIRRNPNYQRISKRKNKDGEYTYTTEAAAVELTLPDGTVFPGKAKETNEKIKEILGVDVNQFTQISMIAQGEFLKLLHAPSKERKEIFARIFDTRIYWQIQNQLKEKSKHLYISLSENELLIKHELQAVQCPKEEGQDFRELQMQWQQTAEKLETGREEIFALLGQMEEVLGQQETDVQEKLQKKEQQQHLVKLQMARAEEVNQQFAQKREMEQSIQEMDRQQKELEQQLITAKQAQSQLEQDMEERLPKLEMQLAEHRNLLPKYQALSQRSIEVEALCKEKDETEKHLSQTQQQEKIQLQKREEIQRNLDLWKPQVEKIPELKQQMQEASTRYREVQELCELGKQLQNKKVALQEAKEAVSKALQRFETCSQDYQDCNRIFIEEQVGILASGLAEGDPCPVCGSVHHPQLAQLKKEAVTQQQVELAKEQMLQAQQTLEQQRELFAGEKELYEGQWQVFKNNGNRLLVSEFQAWEQQEQIEEVVKFLHSFLQEEEKQVRRLEERCNQAEQLQEQYRNQEKQLAENVQRLEVLRTQKEEYQNLFFQKKLSYEKAAQSLQELQESLTYPSQMALEKQIQSLQVQKKELEDRQDKADKLVQKLQQEKARGEGILQEQKKSLDLCMKNLAGKEPVDIGTYKKQEQELQEQKSGLEEELLSLRSVRNGNKAAGTNLEKLYGERQKLSEQYQIADGLSRTANGNLRQQARLDLQTYVQRRYFKYIIGEANRRLIKMTNGRFILQCRELEQLGRQGEAGLDLDVYDMITDRVRDVKTLSGGESFLAALSMALGMADVIQKNAGRVRLDTMFIDEGFGSLDEEARGKAIQILQELAGETRLVGIISHVTELKEQMDRKLVITKSEKGSHACWQIES